MHGIHHVFPRTLNSIEITRKEKKTNSLFDTLIHNCGSNNPQPALGQVSISTVGHYSISANTDKFRKLI